MRKLFTIMLMMVSMAISAQTFNFSCEPLLRGFTITSQNTGEEIEITEGEYLVDQDDELNINIELNRLEEIEIDLLFPVLITPSQKTFQLSVLNVEPIIDEVSIRHNGKLIFRIYIRFI